MKSRTQDVLGQLIASHIAMALIKTMDDWLEAPDLQNELTKQLETAVLLVRRWQELGEGDKSYAEIMSSSPVSAPNLRDRIRHDLCALLTDHIYENLSDDLCDRAVALFYHVKDGQEA